MRKNSSPLESLCLKPFSLTNQLIKKMYVQKNNLNILSKYRCKVKNIKYKLILNDGYLIIKNKESMRKLMCRKMKKITLKEKMWSFNVCFIYNRKRYAFDFKSFNEANDFLEHLIYHKVRAKSI